MSNPRPPYVGTGVDGYLRSAQIDREEADCLDRTDPRWSLLQESAAAWDTRAAEAFADQLATTTGLTDLDRLDAAAAIAGWRRDIDGPGRRGWSRQGDSVTVTHAAGTVTAASFDYRDQPAGPDLADRVTDHLATLPPEEPRR